MTTAVACKKLLADWRAGLIEPLTVDEWIFFEAAGYAAEYLYAYEQHLAIANVEAKMK